MTPPTERPILGAGERVQLAIGIVQAFVFVGAPLFAAGLLQGRARVGWGLFGWGALAWVLSKLVQLPIAWGIGRALPESPGRLLLLLTLAPLFEEGARWLVLRKAARAETERGWEEGMLFGLGHGGVESIVFGLMIFASLLGALAVPEGAAESVQAQAVLEAAPSLRLLAILERLGAWIFHCGASLLVLTAVRERRPLYLLAAMGLHFLLNACAILTTARFGPAFGTAAALGVAMIPLAYLLRARALRPTASDLGEDAAPDPEMAVSCRGLSRRFGDRVAFEGLDLDIKKGELFALLGPNGAGKTTLVRTLSGLIPKSGGRATVAGHEVGLEDEAIRAAVGVLSESPGLYEALSAEANLRIFGGLEGLSEPRLSERIESLLRAFELWERRADPVSSFSKGMRQKVSIARALLHEPPVIFLDEPTSGLDPSAARDLSRLIEELKGKGHTLFLTTHRLAEAEAHADRVGILRRRLLAVDTVEGLRRRVYGERVAFRFATLDALEREEREAALERYLSALCALPGIRSARLEGERILAEVEGADRAIPAAVRALVEAGAAVRGVEELKSSLSDVYLALLENEEGAQP